METFGNVPEQFKDFDKREAGFEVFDKPAYINQLKTLIPLATDRVWVQTMTFDAAEPFLTLKNLLSDAGRRGVDTQFTVDMYHRLLVGGNLYYMPKISRSKREKLQIINEQRADSLLELDQNNVVVTLTNPPHSFKEKLNPARGRNHIKMAIIDNIAFVGDIHNFVSKDQPGIMIKMTDPILVEALAEAYGELPIDRGNYEVAGVHGDKLLVDSGKLPSLILDRAAEVVDSAERSIAMTSQHNPDGSLLDSLQHAQDRGVDVAIYVADPRKVIRPLSRLFDTRMQLLYKKRGYTIPIFEFPGWIHSNVLLVDQESQSAQAIVGTRCYSDTLAEWGTQEISLESRNPHLLDQLGDYVKSLEDASSQRKQERTLHEIVFLK